MPTRSTTLRPLPTLLAVVLLVLGTALARGSVALLLEMPYGDLGTFNPTGHAALYFDHICAASPVQLRPCGPGEPGVVLSRYDGIGTLDWAAIPVIPYLYGVETTDDIPSTMDALTALRMRDLYRRQHLEEVAPDTADGGMPQGNWYQLVGASFDRALYGFQVKTTPDQDAYIIAYFNDRPNITRYQGAFRNCADFSRVILNHLFPHAIHRNYIADFGLTTPKSVAHYLVHYGKKHPELDLQFFQVPQIKGTLPRSLAIQGVTGSLVTRYAIPMAIVAPHVTAVVVLAYLKSGRFSVPKHAPILDLGPASTAVAPLETASAPSQTPYPSSVVGPLSSSGSEVSQHGADGSASLSAADFSEPSDAMWPAAFLTSPACAQCDSVPFLP